MELNGIQEQVVSTFGMLRNSLKLHKDESDFRPVVVLPTFSVKIDVPNVLLPDDDRINGYIEAA